MSQTVDIKVFLTFLLNDRRIRIRNLIRIKEAQKHSDPDPQHWHAGSGVIYIGILGHAI
jgi:hypothetical protein